ncbi:MAG: sulfurtransferase [Candidatus Binataceae bacterium]|jgi:thiosulfate/3-mercaptopyruvate sulfurtransferase
MASDKATANILVDARWLAEHRGDPGLILVDTRAPADYWTGHLEGARHFDPFPFHHSDTAEGPLRDFRGQLEWIFSALGVTAGATVLFYENDSGMRATRAAWALDYMGHAEWRILDGGLKCAGAPNLVTTSIPNAQSNFKGTAREDLIASRGYVVARLGQPGVQIFDVRSDEEYFGERVRAKHAGAIPGSIHRDWTHHLAADGRFKPPAQLHQEFEGLGLDSQNEIIPYCQGGYRSANAYVALRIAGYPRVRNYLGSWGEWGNRDDLPIEHPRRKVQSKGGPGSWNA